MRAWSGKKDKRMTAERAGYVLTQKTNRRRMLMMLFFVVLTLVLTMLMIRLVMSSTSSRPELYIVREGTITNQIFSPMLIVRNEEILSSPASGILSPLLVDGNKIAKNAPAAYIVSHDGAAIWEKLGQAKRKLSSRQLDLLYEGDFSEAQTAFQHTDKALKPLINQLHIIDENNLRNAEGVIQQIDISINERNQELLSISTQDEVIQTIKQEITTIEAALEPYSSEAKVPKSGIINFYIDNLSGKHTVEDIENMDAKQIQEIADSYIDESRDVVREVREGQAYGAILSDMYQYFVYVLTEYEASDFPLTRKYGINAPSLGIHLDKIELVSARDSEGKVILVFRTASQMKSLLTSRVLDTTITMQSDKGLKVPNEVLRYPDAENPQRASVMVLISGYVYETYVDIMRQDEDYAIVSSTLDSEQKINNGSVIILNPEAVVAGEQLGS